MSINSTVGREIVKEKKARTLSGQKCDQKVKPLNDQKILASKKGKKKETTQ